jgi:type IV pilus biogenesis protein CpaD/CtpE
LAFVARVNDERDWNEVGAFVRRYVQAFSADDPTLLSITVSGSLTASTLGNRIEKLLARMDIDPARAADVEVVDEGEAASVRAKRIVTLESLEERNPSALRRKLDLVMQ